MIPLWAFALGALFAALWGAKAFFGLLLLPFWRRGGPYVLGVLGVLISLTLHPDPWGPDLGRALTLSGRLEKGFLHTSKGLLYVHAYPPLTDGHYRLSGVLRRPRPPRNPGGFDEAGWLKGLGVFAVLERPRVLAYRPFKPGPRGWIRARLKEGQSPAVGALAEALVLGDRRPLGARVRVFRDAGLAHLMALSGLHLGLLAGAVIWAFGFLGRGRYLLALLAALGYLALAGASPSLVRAFLMLLAWSGFALFGKGRPDPRRVLPAAFGVQLVLFPHSAFSLGFWLSYLAVAGLVFGLGALRVRGLGLALATPILATLPLVPILLDRFHQLPLASVLSNLVAVPHTGVFLTLAFLKGLGLVFLAPALEAAGRGLLSVAGFFSAGPKLHWGAIGPGGYLLYYAALLALFLAARGRLAWPRALLLVALAGLFSLAASRVPVLEVWQLDVGEGHATLVRLDPGPALLIDAGPDWAGPRVVRALKALGLNHLDLLVLTHPDRDHAGGAVAVLRALPVGRVLTNPAHPEDAALRAARLLGVPVLRAGYGDRARLGPLGLFFWNPPWPLPEGDNARSLVTEVVWKSRRVVVLGDLPTSGEGLLPQRPADVLVASHHGAKNGTGPVALTRLRPHLVLIGVGKNPFGHPDPATLRRIRAHGARALRTDRLGAIRVRLAP